MFLHSILLSHVSQLSFFFKPSSSFFTHSSITIGVVLVWEFFYYPIQGIPISFYFIFINISVYYIFFLILCCSFFLFFVLIIWEFFYYLFQGIPIIFRFIFVGISVYYIFIFGIFGFSSIFIYTNLIYIIQIFFSYHPGSHSNNISS